MVTYNVYRNGTKANASPVTDTTFTDTNVTAGTSYAASEVDQFGQEGPLCDPVVVPGAPPAPVGLAIASFQNGTLVLTWKQG